MFSPENLSVKLEKFFDCDSSFNSYQCEQTDKLLKWKPNCIQKVDLINYRYLCTMSFLNRRIRFHYLAFIKHDLKASITVFFVALPLCLGISLASNAPIYSGLIAGIIGGLVVSFISKSELSVSGPAAGLTAISIAAISELGSIELFFLAVSIAGFIQLMLGIFRLGGFTHFIPSSVIKGMLAAIGIILMSKQIPIMLGYDQPDFWRNELFNILTFSNGFEHITKLYEHTSGSVIFISLLSLALLTGWKKTLSKKLPFIPASFITVVAVVFLVLAGNSWLSLKPSQFISLDKSLLSNVRLPQFNDLFQNSAIWLNALVICAVASLESLLSVEAIDKLDPYNRVTPKNRELVAQGAGNMLSGLFGGIPITAVIVRSSANAEAGARTRLSSIAHGVWLTLALLFAIPLLNMIPYCVLAVILVRTGYNLAKPKMIRAIYKQGNEQFLPFIVTAFAILFTDMLIGVGIGLIYALYYLVKHTYRAGFTIRENTDGHTRHIIIELALNVSYLNKKKIIDTLDRIPEYSIVEVIGSDSVYIDHDILEILQQYKSKAHRKHIQLILKDIPEVSIIEIH